MTTTTTTTSKLPRRGRPPVVTVSEDGTSSVTVKGKTYSFRNGRAVGANRAERGEDFDYAKTLVNRYHGATE